MTEAPPQTFNNVQTAAFRAIIYDVLEELAGYGVFAPNAQLIIQALAQRDQAARTLALFPKGGQ